MLLNSFHHRCLPLNHHPLCLHSLPALGFAADQTVTTLLVCVVQQRQPQLHRLCTALPNPPRGGRLRSVALVALVCVGTLETFLYGSAVC